MAAIPAGTPVQVHVEIASSDARIQLDGRKDTAVSWHELPADGRPGDALLVAVRDAEIEVVSGVEQGERVVVRGAGFLKDGILTSAQVSDVAEYVLSLSGRADDAEAASRGQAVFAEQCVACHQQGGVGSRELGAPNLADSVWLYGGSKAAIVESISFGRSGVMPSWEGRLSPATLKLLAVYVHDLGGGQ